MSPCDATSRRPTVNRRGGSAFGGSRLRSSASHGSRMSTQRLSCFPSRRCGGCADSRLPSTWMTSVSGSTAVPCAVTTVPLTLTAPFSMSASQARRDATPAAAITCGRRMCCGGESRNWQGRVRKGG
eukprot:365232-Chlamydomonas_euryale.AAC.13